MKQSEKKTRSQNALYARLLFIDRQIASGKYPNSKTLAKEYEVSQITIKRDIDYLRDIMDAPIAYDAARRGLYYTVTSFRLPALFTTEEELLAAGMCARLLAQYKGTPLYGQVKHIFEKMSEILVSGTDSFGRGKGKADPLWFEKRLCCLDEPVPVFAPEVWHTLMKAMHANRLVKITYSGAWVTEPLVHVLAPYQLLCRRGMWYFAGFSEQNGTVKPYALNRIKSIELTQECFNLPPDYDYRTTNGGDFGVFTAGEKLQCKVRFFDEAVTWISEREWVKNQHIEPQSDGSIIMTFESTQLYETLSWILSQGMNALPLEPKELTDMWKTHVRVLYEAMEQQGR